MAIDADKIIELVVNALEMKKGYLTLESISEDIEEWDSLGHLSILIALDKKFDGQIGKIKEMAAVDSVAQIIALLEKHSLELP
jgi:acyl carrier protein